MSHPSSEILIKYLIDETELFTLSTRGSTWPIFQNVLPGNKNIQSAGVIFDTGGILDGRLMSTGETIDHPGIQVRVRSKDPSSGYNKLKDVCDKFASIHNASVEMADGTEYVINSITRISTILPIGIDPETKLFEFTVNFIVSITL